jgi:hypothetical protein
MNNPYKYNSMMEDQDPQNQPVCVGKDPSGVCEVIGQSCAGEGECGKTFQCFQGNNEQDAISQCEGSGGGPLGPPHGGKPHGGKPHGGKPIGGKPIGGKPIGGKPIGGQGGKTNGGSPSPSPGSKNWWNTPAGIATIIAIALGSAILITLIFWLIRRAVSKKKRK